MDFLLPMNVSVARRGTFSIVQLINKLLYCHVSDYNSMDKS
jgi:hypothetical protein